MPTESQPLVTLATDKTKATAASKEASKVGDSTYQCPYLVSQTTTLTSADIAANPIFIADESADAMRFPPVPAGGFANIADAIESVERWSATRTVVRREPSTSVDQTTAERR